MTEANTPRMWRLQASWETADGQGWATGAEISGPSGFSVARDRADMLAASIAEANQNAVNIYAVAEPGRQNVFNESPQDGGTVVQWQRDLSQPLITRSANTEPVDHVDGIGELQSLFRATAGRPTAESRAYVFRTLDEIEADRANR